MQDPIVAPTEGKPQRALSSAQECGKIGVVCWSESVQELAETSLR
jgi:hypothetical protein